MTDLKTFDWEKYIKECLESTYYCALATQGEDGAWVNPVYFAYDRKWNLYFISQSSSKHMQNIGNNQNVSVAIYSTDQKPGGDVFGIQLSGKAIKLSDEEIVSACEIYYGRKGAADAVGEEKPDPKQHMGDNAVWKFVKVIPQEMYYFDTRFFGEERERVPLAELVKK